MTRRPNIPAAKQLRSIIEELRPDKIVVHAGRVKTGSTFLQAALIENAERLAQQDWIFPKSLFHSEELQIGKRRLRSEGHAILARIALGRPVEGRLLREFRGEVAGKQGARLLFSAEVLGRDPRENLLRNLAVVLDGLDVDVVMYLRRPSAWIESYYVEMVTAGLMREYRQFEACKDDYQAAANAQGFVEQCAVWQRRPRLLFRNYDLARTSGNTLLQDFAEAVGLPQLDEPELKDINKSPGIALVRGIRIFNALTRGLSGARFHRSYAELLDRIEMFEDGSRGFFMPKSEAEAVDSDWARMNRGLVEGKHIARDAFIALTAENVSKIAETDALRELQVLTEVCNFLVEKGVNGFAASPTVVGIGRELGRRVVDGLRRRMKRR